MSTGLTVALTAAEAADVRALLEQIESADGTAAVSEAFLLRLGDAPDAGRVRHALARDVPGTLVGYAVSETGDRPAAELAVLPAARRQGHGTALLGALREAAGAPLYAWAHGDLPAAAAFGASVGAERIRTLLELRRPAAEVAVPEPAPGVVVRTFVPGQDDAAWLRVNAEAFATHPEQGAWTQQDLAERLAEPWFDPAGFFLAERDGELLAFHWTKIAEPHTGEVYVVGVSPHAQGLGLGRLMTAVGLAHLHRAGVRDISLFVDGENTTAVSLYRSLGFGDHHADAQWRTR